MDERTEGRTDGRTGDLDGRTDGTNGWTDGWDGRTDGTEGQTDGRANGTDGRTDGRVDGRVDGRTNGRMDGRTDGRAEGRTEGWMDIFNRYRKEFICSDSYGNFWIGNDCLHHLTNGGNYKVRFDIQDSYSMSWLWAEYNEFIVDDESTNYTLHIGNYTGNATDAVHNVQNLNGTRFTTVDRDNDLLTSSAPKIDNLNCGPTSNCATYCGGGFWYRACTMAHITSKNNWVISQPITYWKGSSSSQINFRIARMTLMCLRN